MGHGSSSVMEFGLCGLIGRNVQTSKHLHGIGIDQLEWSYCRRIINIIIIAVGVLVERGANVQCQLRFAGACASQDANHLFGVGNECR